jgi:hypothetical protein
MCSFAHVTVAHACILFCYSWPLIVAYVVAGEVALLECNLVALAVISYNRARCSLLLHVANFSWPCDCCKCCHGMCQTYASLSNLCVTRSHPQPETGVVAPLERSLDALARISYINCSPFTVAVLLLLVLLLMWPQVKWRRWSAM